MPLNKSYKPKRCKNCGQTYTPRQLGQKVCSIPCSLEWGRKERIKERQNVQKKRDKAIKEKLKTKSDWTKEAQADFNKWVRLRDLKAGYGCVSCGTKNPQHSGRGGLWDAGHYLTRGSHPEKRFDPDNVHLQCKKCNRNGFSSQRYREELLTRIGPERLAKVEGPTPMPHHTKDDLKAIRDKYRALWREIEKGAE